MIKTITAVAALSTLALTPASAAGYTQGTINGYQAYIYDSGSYSGTDYIEVYGPNGKEEILVRCAPFDWESTGPNTATFVDNIARKWCF